MGVRRIPPKTRSQSGQFWSRKNGGILVPYESLLEHDFCVNLEFEEGVSCYESQPARIQFKREGRNCPGYPDFLVTRLPGAGAAQVIVDVKTTNDLRANWAHLKPRLRAACAYARSHGMTYKIHDERRIRTPFFYNARRLLRHLREEPDPAYESVILGALHLMQRATIESLLHSAFADSIKRVEALNTFWILIAHRRIGIDLRLAIDDVSTPIWYKDGMDREKIA